MSLQAPEFVQNLVSNHRFQLAWGTSNKLGSLHMVLWPQIGPPCMLGMVFLACHREPLVPMDQLSLGAWSLGASPIWHFSLCPQTLSSQCSRFQLPMCMWFLWWSRRGSFSALCKDKFVRKLWKIIGRHVTSWERKEKKKNIYNDWNSLCSYIPMYKIQI